MNPIEQAAMEIIIHVGEGKSLFYQALDKAKEFKFEEADVLMVSASEEITLAHRAQTRLLQQEASGEPVEMTLLFTHAQDHLMTAITEKNLVSQLIGMSKWVHQLMTDKGGQFNGSNSTNL